MNSFGHFLSGIRSLCSAKLHVHMKARKRVRTLRPLLVHARSFMGSSSSIGSAANATVQVLHSSAVDDEVQAMLISATVFP